MSPVRRTERRTFTLSESTLSKLRAGLPRPRDGEVWWIDLLDLLSNSDAPMYSFKLEALLAFMRDTNIQDSERRAREFKNIK